MPAMGSPVIMRTQFAVMLHLIPYLGPAGITRLISDIPRGNPDDWIDLSLFQAWNMSADTLQRVYKLHPRAAECLSTKKEKLLSSSAEIASTVDSLGIRIITTIDPDYPSLICEYYDMPPPILYAYGNLALLREKKFAIVSSSSMSSHSAEISRELAGTLSDQGLVAVTSHNTEAYQVVGLAAKSRNSPLILVLDRGILSAFPQGLDWEPVAQARIWNLRFDRSRDLVISSFRLYDHWIGANGHERDKMVFGLADVVIAVDIRPDGVMQRECLRARTKGREVYVYKPFDGKLQDGNAKLLEKGCDPIPSEWAQSLLRTLDWSDIDVDLEGEF